VSKLTFASISSPRSTKQEHAVSTETSVILSPPSQPEFDRKIHLSGERLSGGTEVSLADAEVEIAARTHGRVRVEAADRPALDQDGLDVGVPEPQYSSL
jgi:hypothetical protein